MDVITAALGPTGADGEGGYTSGDEGGIGRPIRAGIQPIAQLVDPGHPGSIPRVKACLQDGRAAWPVLWNVHFWLWPWKAVEETRPHLKVQLQEPLFSGCIDLKAGPAFRPLDDKCAPIVTSVPMPSVPFPQFQRALCLHRAYMQFTLGHSYAIPVAARVPLNDVTCSPWPASPQCCTAQWTVGSCGVVTG